MVNESHSPGRAGRVPSEAGYQLQLNPDAALLEVGSIVKPNFVSQLAQESHPPGVILSITNGVAQVRWKTLRVEPYGVYHLIKV